MNQYPAFMPMVVPRPYMVAMPANALQMAPPGLAGMGAMAGMGGMAAMSGMAPGVLPHPSLQMVNPQLAAAQLAAAHGNPVTTAGAMPMMATGIPGMTQGIPMPPGSLAMGGLGAMAGLMDMKRGILGTEEAHRYAGAELQQLEASLSIKPEVQLEDVKPIVLDPYNSDLHLEIDEDSCGACPLTEPSGFCFVWAGARATHGVCTGKVFYEIHITENLPVDFGHDHNETNPHIIRVGWSVNSSTFQLGEEPMSYGYGGTSKFSTNNKFSNYGEIFGAGDVIGAMLDLDSTPATISYMKNGTWLGIAMPIHGYQVGNDKMALFPHILSKNCRFRVNFGQIDPWFQPPRGYTYLEKIPGFQRVRGLIEPERFEDCEMIMVVGLPGAGKTLWGVNMEKNHPEKRYNVMGSDTLIDRMKVMGLPRKRNYHGRWEVLIDKSTKCLNRIFKIACKKKRNYVLDQTNVYASARKRKMKDFQKYYRIAAVIQPENVELERRSYKRTHEDGKFVPDEAVREMKANYSLPTYEENLFDRIDFIELQREAAEPLVRQYNDECKHLKKKQQPFRNDRQNQEKGQYGAGGQVNYPLQDQYYGQQGGGYQGRYGNQGNTGEPASKRSKMEPGSALDFIKQEYAEEDKEKALKDEPKWDKNQYGGDLYSQAVNFQFQDQFAHLRPDPFQVLQGQFMQPRPPISEDMLRQLAQSKPPAWPQEKEAVISWLPKSDPQEQGLYPFFPGRQFQGSSVDWQRNESQQGNWSSTVKEKSQSQQWQQSGSVGQSPSTVPSGRSSFDNSSYDKSGSSSSFDEQKFGQSKSFQGDQSKSSYGRPDQSRQFDRNRDDQNRSVGQQDQDDQYHKQRESGNYMNRSDNESSNRNQSYNQREQPQQPQQRYQQGRSGSQSFGSGDEGRGNESRNRSYGQDSSSNKPGSRDYAYGRERRDSSNYRSSSRDSHSYGSRDRDRPDSRISEKSSDGPTHSDSRDTFSSDFRGTERSSGFEPSPSEISSSSDRQSVTPKDSQEIGNGGRVRKRKSKWDVPGEDNGNDSPPVPPVVVKTPANLSAIIAKLEQAGKDHQNAEGKQQTKGSSPHTADTSSKEEKPKDLPSLQDSLQQPPPPPLGMPPTGMSQRPPFPPRGPGFPGGPRFNPHNAPPLPPFGPGSDGPRNFRPRNPQNFGPGHQGPGQWNHPPPFGNGPRGPGGPRGPRGFGGPRGPRGPRGPGGPRGHRPMNPRFGGDGNRFPRPPNMRW